MIQITSQTARANVARARDSLPFAERRRPQIARLESPLCEVNMHPFVEHALCNARCGGCDEPIETKSVVAVGILTNDGPISDHPRPLAMVQTLCAGCGMLTVLTAPVDLPSLLAAVEEEYQRYGRREARQQAKDHPSNQPGAPPTPIMPPEMVAPTFGRPCTRCGVHLTADSISGLAIIRAVRPVSESRGTDYAVLVDCAECGAQQAIVFSLSMPQFIRIAGAYNWYLSDRADDRAADGAGGVATASESDPSRRGADPRVRPSLRRYHERSPISDREVEQFVKLLKRTSFKRDTVSFRRFMRKLGVKHVD